MLPVDDSTSNPIKPMTNKGGFNYRMRLLTEDVPSRRTP